jgi:hypothetical protein
MMGALKKVQSRSLRGSISVSNIIHVFISIYQRERERELTRLLLPGVYFSRTDSPPCRRFTPELLQVYADLKKEKKSFEVLFVISDKNLLDQYTRELPWAGLLLPPSGRARLTNRFKVDSV